MNMQVMKRVSMAAGVKILLATVSPLQPLLDRPGLTHEFCNLQALTILAADSLQTEADFIAQYTGELNKGVYWADQGWKNIGHYWVPSSGKGLWEFNSALMNFKYYYLSSLRLARHGNYAKSVFFLGAAAHLVQDMCVPHHARCKLFAGHQEYETWAQRHYRTYAVSAHGIYPTDKNAEDLLCSNASTAADLLSWVDQKDTPSYYHVATDLMLPMAQRSTAGLFWHYTNAVTKYAGKLASIKKHTVA